jgi:hypothetical protein
MHGWCRQWSRSNKLSFQPVLPNSLAVGRMRLRHGIQNPLMISWNFLIFVSSFAGLRMQPLLFLFLLASVQVLSRSGEWER